jgi:pimeloyl-ACP methyl ester carboxylesterase
MRAALVLLPALLVGAPAAAEGPKPLPFKVKVVGKGRPMILIPGLTCAGEVWDSTVEHYKDKYECHVLTLAGFAGQPPIPAPFLDSVRQGLARYIRERKLDRPVVIGHSLGGFLVYALGVSDPDLVGPLVAVDGVPCLGALWNEKVDAAGLKKQADRAQEEMAKITADQYRAQTKVWTKNWLTDPKVREVVEKWVERSDRDTTVRAMAELIGTDLRPQLGRIKTRVLLLGAWSKDSEAYGLTREQAVKRYESQVAGVPRHKVVVADNAKHFIMFDAPQWMFGQIDAFLAEN